MARRRKAHYPDDDTTPSWIKVGLNKNGLITFKDTSIPAWFDKEWGISEMYRRKPGIPPLTDEELETILRQAREEPHLFTIDEIHLTIDTDGGSEKLVQRYVRLAFRRTTTYVIHTMQQWEELMEKARYIKENVPKFWW